MNNLGLILFIWIFEYFINVRLHQKVVRKKDNFSKNICYNFFNFNFRLKLIAYKYQIFAVGEN